MATYNAKVEEDRLFAAQRRMLKRDYPLSKIPTPLDQTCSQFKSAELSPWFYRTFDAESPVLQVGDECGVAIYLVFLKAAGLAKLTRTRDFP